MISEVLPLYNLNANECIVQKISTGLINQTWKISAGNKAYILQQINTNIFVHPEWIADNVQHIAVFLQKHYPAYLLAVPLQSTNGTYLVKDATGKYFRLLPFIANTHTIDTVTSTQQAFEAAKQFGLFAHALASFDASLLHTTLPGFHNLSLRFEQFTNAVSGAEKDVLQKAAPLVEEAYRHQHIAHTYRTIVDNKILPLRVMHHDTKISNVLFDDKDGSVCVIDLDTVMPGYIISDVGDMMRTYLSPVSEEEQDLDKIIIREDYFKAIVHGYTKAMGDTLTTAEKDMFIYAGKFMIYMQAIRFLTDFLNNNQYYGAAYPLHNVNRSHNQFVLLNKFIEAEEKLRALV